MRVLMMIEKEKLAEVVSARLLAVFQELENTVRLVASQSSEEELQRYKQAIGCVCGSLVLDVLGPLYTAHPGIKPESWNDE
jgi:hypothetical protein